MGYRGGIDFRGFPLPDQVEDKLRGNDENRSFMRFYEFANIQ
jgi:hypothetical protein